MFEDLRNNITRLISLYETEKQRADELSEELGRSRAAEEACMKQIAQLERQIDNQRLAGALTAGDGNPEARERLDKLIHEIDRCIALLEE